MKGIVTKLNNEWVVKYIALPTIGRKAEFIYYPLESGDYLNNLKEGIEIEFSVFDKNTSLDWDRNVVARIKNEERYLDIPLNYINELINEIDEEKSIADSLGREDIYDFCRGKIEILEYLKEKFLK